MPFPGFGTVDGLDFDRLGFNMQSVLIIVHLIIVLALVGVVLLQRSEGGGLGMGGGSSSGAGFMTSRGQTNVLTRTTAILATLFFITSLALTIIASRHAGSGSIFDKATEGAVVPGGISGGDSGFERLQQLQQNEAPVAPAPVAPAAPQVPNSQ